MSNILNRPSSEHRIEPIRTISLPVMIYDRVYDSKIDYKKFSSVIILRLCISVRYLI